MINLHRFGTSATMNPPPNGTEDAALSGTGTQYFGIPNSCAAETSAVDRAMLVNCDNPDAAVVVRFVQGAGYIGLYRILRSLMVACSVRLAEPCAAAIMPSGAELRPPRKQASDALESILLEIVKAHCRVDFARPEPTSIGQEWMAPIPPSGELDPAFEPIQLLEMWS